MPEGYPPNPEQESFGFDELQIAFTGVLAAQKANDNEEALRLRSEAMGRLVTLDDNQLLEIYLQGCTAYRANENPEFTPPEAFDRSTRAAWIRLHGYLEERFVDDDEKRAQMDYINKKSLADQSALSAELRYGSSELPRAMPQRILPPEQQ